jgi:hypothetical protein
MRPVDLGPSLQGRVPSLGGRMQPTRRYAIESRWAGPEDEAPWKGWKLTRMYPSAAARDEDYLRLLSLRSPNWEYRVKR